MDIESRIKRILLINPPWYRMFGQGSNASPLGLCYIGGVLNEQGYEVVIYNADFKKGLGFGAGVSQITKKYGEYLRCLNNTGHPLWREIADVISEVSPDIVGVSVTTAKYGSALNVSRLVRNFSADVPVVWGGVHPTILPDETIKNREVDIVVRGEGEYTFLNLVREPRHLKSILGITFKGENGSIIHTPDRPLVENLDLIPFPARHLLREKENHYPENFGNLFATRGCPYSCTFCASHKVWTRKVRYRSPKNIVDEIRILKDTFKTNIFTFEDDSFTLDKRFVENLCDLMIKEKLNVKWSTETRANLVGHDLMKKMKSS